MNITHLPLDAVFAEMASPVGKLTIVAVEQGLCAILWEGEIDLGNRVQSKNNKIILDTQEQLSEYFAGQRKSFTLPLVLKGTDFQIQAWQQLLKIPFGSTISYGEQAARLGDKNKARAVGMANGQNPISIIVPCHRVIGSNGSLTGFGGGLACKEWLLEHEQRVNK